MSRLFKSGSTEYSRRCILHRDQVGDKAVGEILWLTEQHCLYPHEIMGLIEHLKSGGNTENLIEKSLNDKFDYFGALPTLDDVKKDLTERRRKQERER